MLTLNIRALIYNNFLNVCTWIISSKGTNLCCIIADPPLPLSQCLLYTSLMQKPWFIIWRGKETQRNMREVKCLLIHIIQIISGGKFCLHFLLLQSIHLLWILVLILVSSFEDICITSVIHHIKRIETQVINYQAKDKANAVAFDWYEVMQCSEEVTANIVIFESTVLEKINESTSDIEIQKSFSEGMSRICCWCVVTCRAS